MIRFVPLQIFILLAVAGCWDPYTLPDPPPTEERRDVSLIPGQEKRQREQEYLDARASIVQLNALLSQQRFAEAEALIGIETKSFLTHGTEAPVTDVLASGELTLPTGEVVKFDPVNMLIAPDISKLVDELDGMAEQETANRKEIYAVLPEGKVRKIVMIREANTWVLHRTRIPQNIDAPK